MKELKIKRKQIIDLEIIFFFIDFVITKASYIALQQKQKLYKLSFANSKDIDYNNKQVNKETVFIFIIITKKYKEIIQFNIILIKKY